MEMLIFFVALLSLILAVAGFYLVWVGINIYWRVGAQKVKCSLGRHEWQQMIHPITLKSGARVCAWCGSNELYPTNNTK